MWSRHDHWRLAPAGEFRSKFSTYNDCKEHRKKCLKYRVSGMILKLTDFINYYDYLTIRTVARVYGAVVCTHCSASVLHTEGRGFNPP